MEFASDKHSSCTARESMATARAGPPRGVSIQRVHTTEEIRALGQARVQAFRANGVSVDDAPFAELRPHATNLAAYVGTELAGGLSLWRLSAAGMLHHPPPLQRLLSRRNVAAEDVVEAGLLFVSPRYRKRGVARRLLLHARPIALAMNPRLVVTLAVEHEAHRYMRVFGFRPVGPPTLHPFSPAIRIVPLMLTRARLDSRPLPACPVGEEPCVKD